jgi:hypothetical protein
MEGQLDEIAEHAEALEEYIRTVGFAASAAGVIPLGPDELDRIVNFFLHLKVGCRKIPVDLRALRQVIAPLADEWRKTASELSSAYWGLLVDAAAREVEAKGTAKPPTVSRHGVEDSRGIR